MVKPPTGGTAAGRGMGTKMKTADTKSMSSQQWIKRQLSDKWSERARAEGWPALHAELQVLQGAAFNAIDVEPLGMIDLRFNGIWRLRLPGMALDEEF